MTITASVVKDSISPLNIRLTTVQLRYPRFIHSELMTHRVFSRNASSSRAIPVSKLIQDVIDDPAMPVYWGRNQPGMQADTQIDNKEEAERLWLVARDDAVRNARIMNDLGLHKQVVNRVLEPFSHINVLVSGTDWTNFSNLRDHPDAQPEIKVLAVAIKQAMSQSRPQRLDYGQWHLPYIDEDMPLSDALKVSAARCASVSYKTVDGKPMTVEKALEIYDKLAGSDPIHASPFEHQATPTSHNNKTMTKNFTGYVQNRWYIENGVTPL